jgi:uncharacterized membrane protein YedE/YeeE
MGWGARVVSTAIASFICGLIFGFGLLISGMTDPVKVLGFLDILGPWDPTLGFVMVGALAVSAAGFAVAKRRGAPVLASQCLWPARRSVDASLVAGSILFGIGWGLVGLCPGPAIENLATLSPRVVLFVVAMVLGMMLQEAWQRLARAARPPVGAAIAEAVDG